MYEDDCCDGSDGDDTNSHGLPEPVTVTLTLDLSSLRGQAVDQAARMLASEARREVLDLVQKAVATAVAEALAGKVEEMVTAELTRPRLPVNRYGSPLPDAQPETLAESVVKRTRDWCEAKVNASGSLDDYRGTTTRGNWVVEQAIGKSVETVAKAEVQAAVKDLRERLGTAAQKELGTAVLRLIGMRD